MQPRRMRIGAREKQPGSFDPVIARMVIEARTGFGDRLGRQWLDDRSRRDDPCPGDCGSGCGRCDRKRAKGGCDGGCGCGGTCSDPEFDAAVARMIRDSQDGWGLGDANAVRAPTLGTPGPAGLPTGGGTPPRAAEPCLIGEDCDDSDGPCEKIDWPSDPCRKFTAADCGRRPCIDNYAPVPVPGPATDAFKLADDRLFSKVSDCFEDLVAEVMKLLQDNVSIVDYYCCMYYGPGSEECNCLHNYIVGEADDPIDFNADNDCGDLFNPFVVNNGCNLPADDPDRSLGCTDRSGDKPHIHFCDLYMDGIDELACQSDPGCRAFAVRSLAGVILHELTHFCTDDDLHWAEARGWLGQFGLEYLADDACFPVEDLAGSVVAALEDLGQTGPFKCADGVDLCNTCPFDAMAIIDQTCGPAFVFFDCASVGNL